MGQAERPIQTDDSDLRRSKSSKFSLKAKPSFAFRKKGSRPTSSQSAPSSIDPDKTPPAGGSVPGSPNSTLRSQGPGPTPAQAAYIQRIISGPVHNGHGHDTDPLARLRAANSAAGGEGATVNVPISTETGLEESLKNFTSVEVLEGENAFACRKCYKIKSGKYTNEQEKLQEEDESITSELTSPPLSATRMLPPAMPIISTSSDSGSDRISLPEDEGRSGRTGSAASRSSAARLHRAPSPLRKLIEMDGDTKEQVYASSALSSESIQIAESPAAVDPGADDNPESDGLSGTSSEEDEPPPQNLPVGIRPKTSRRKSSYFIMRRAFKRYLIAKAPEVLVFHFKRFRQTHKSGLTFTSFYDLRKWVGRPVAGKVRADDIALGWTTLFHSRRCWTSHRIWRLTGTTIRWFLLSRAPERRIWIGNHQNMDQRGDQSCIGSMVSHSASSRAV